MSNIITNTNHQEYNKENINNENLIQKDKLKNPISNSSSKALSNSDQNINLLRDQLINLKDHLNDFQDPIKPKRVLSEFHQNQVKSGERIQFPISFTMKSSNPEANKETGILLNDTLQTLGKLERIEHLDAITNHLIIRGNALFEKYNYEKKIT